MKITLKTTILKGLYFLFFFASLSAYATSFPVKNSNPWKDNYADISGIEHYKSWGTYNVHDPSCLKIGDAFYMYSTDAIYQQRRADSGENNVKPGFIQLRSSKDLVHWNFEGWAFPEIPQEARNWVLSHNNNKGATNIWAPYIVQHNGKFRLYYCVSAFGLQISYIGLAESDSPRGPWAQKGAVVKTQRGDKMNAIDPSIVTDSVTGKMWMHYGSYFGGLFVVEINPATGLTIVENDQGESIARRANMKKDNIEAPEIIYNPAFKKYYLFTSYDPLMTTYNVRVGRADKPEGPFYDFFGNDLRDTVNHYPILTHPYRFDNHPGWAGTAHCSVFKSKSGAYYMAHQARLSPENQMMDLHVREIKWTEDGWPVVSPQRYTASAQSKITSKDMTGTWEIIRIQDAKTDRNLEFGQILWGEGQLRKTEIDVSKKVELLKNGKISGSTGSWRYSNRNLSLLLKDETIQNLIVFVGHDWENQTETVLFTGLDKNGCSVWGKKVF